MKVTITVQEMKQMSLPLLREIHYHDDVSHKTTDIFHMFIRGLMVEIHTEKIKGDLKGQGINAEVSATKSKKIRQQLSLF